MNFGHYSRRACSAGRLAKIALLATAAVFPAQSQILNRNLILNGDAEAGADAARNATDPQVKNIPNWTVTGGFSIGSYGGGSFLASDDYGPASRGTKFFYGGPGAQHSTAIQTVDLTGAATDIDAGRTKFYLSGHLGFIAGSYDQINLINLKAEFQDAAGTVLLTSTAPGPSSTDIHVPAGLLLRTAGGFLPANVRKAKITIDLASGSSGYNGFAADNISLVLTTDPMLGVNLLVNGDGETNPQSDNGYPVPGWNADTNFLVARWGDYKMPVAGDPGPSNRGKYFFECANNEDQCRAYQIVDFTNAAKLVDAGKVTYSATAWLGGDSGAPDTADVAINFLDASGKTLSASPVRMGPVTQSDRGNQRGLWQRTAGGPVPAGARSVQFNLYFHKVGPASENNYGYADSLAFQLDSIQVTSVVNAASSQSGPVAPGEFVTIYGSSMGPATGVIAQGTQKGLAGVKVTFNGVEAYLTYASAGQVNAVAPYAPGSKADVMVQYNGLTSDPFPLLTTESSPGIFTQQYGLGQAWVVNNDGNFNSSAHPVSRGGWIEFWATGQGLVDPAGQDGELLSGFKNLKLPVKVSIGGIDTQVLGSLLIYTGEIQVNAMVPSSVAPGNAELILTIGGTGSRKGVTVAVQ
jgi:uncharacterized protein (TIGR03437 family)